MGRPCSDFQKLSSGLILPLNTSRRRQCPKHAVEKSLFLCLRASDLFIVERI